MMCHYLKQKDENKLKERKTGRGSGIERKEERKKERKEQRK